MIRDDPEIHRDECGLGGLSGIDKKMEKNVDNEQANDKLHST